MFCVQPQYAEIMSRLGWGDAAAVFADPRIRVWRSIRERENATLDATGPDGSTVRFHVKRDKSRQTWPAGVEARQMLALNALGIATPNLVAHGGLPDGRTFVITEHLAGYEPADTLIAKGLPFETLIEPTAAVAGRLHARGAFHRDLYLCHFFVRPDASDVRLIDCARVLIGPFWRTRWRVKDLAQFVYSTRALRIEPAELERWLDAYSVHAGGISPRLRRRVERKADRIAHHDARLRRQHPERTASLWK